MFYSVGVSRDADDTYPTMVDLIQDEVWVSHLLFIQCVFFNLNCVCFIYLFCLVFDPRSQWYNCSCFFPLQNCSIPSLFFQIRKLGIRLQYLNIEVEIKNLEDNKKKARQKQLISVIFTETPYSALPTRK